VKIDRLLIDIWDWIRRVLWWEKGKNDSQPHLGTLGEICPSLATKAL
jgi:hypothetical protein